MNLRHQFICKRLALAGFLSLTLASQTAIASDSGTPLPPARAGGLSQLERIPLAKLLQQPQLDTGKGSLRAPAAAPIMPQRLAQSLPIPAAQQREVEQAYSQLLSIYRQAMRQGGLPDDDIGVALGAFIVANYQVASDSSIDDEVSKAAYRQMQQLLAAEPSLQKLDGAHRQALFEELAIMAMTMETIFEQGERAALERAQPAARQYLQAVLQRPYNALRFTAGGMTLAER